MPKYRVCVEQVLYEFYEVETKLTNETAIRHLFADEKSEGLLPQEELTEESDYRVIEIEKIGD